MTRTPYRLPRTVESSPSVHAWSKPSLGRRPSQPAGGPRNRMLPGRDRTEGGAGGWMWYVERPARMMSSTQLSNSRVLRSVPQSHPRIMEFCPACRSSDIRYREKRDDWICDHCDHRWRSEAAATTAGSAQAPLRIFLSYGRQDAKELAERLAVDLSRAGHEIWLDTRRIQPGSSWQHEITDGLRSSQIVIALMSPHSVRTRESLHNVAGTDSVCLGEIAYALFNPPPQPVIPVMAAPCEPPLAIYHLDYVELTRWRDSESQYRDGLNRLLQYVASVRERREPLYRSWYHQLQPWDFAAFLHDKRKDFTGREWLFEEIDAWRKADRAHRVLLITGDPGVGKSAIVAELVHHNRHGQVVAYHCCQSDTQATLEPWRFVRSVAAMLASRLPDYAGQFDVPAIRDSLSEESCRNDAASAFERGILAPLETLPAPGDGVRYLLIDALDEALALVGSRTIIDLLSSRIDRLPAWLRIVATTRKEPSVLRQLQGLPARELRADDPRNLDDLGDYIRSRLGSAGMQDQLNHVVGSSAAADVGTFTARAVDVLKTRSGGNFLYVRQALDGLEQPPDDEGRRPFSLERLEELPTGLTGMYELFFRRQFGSKGERYREVKSILEVVCAAREPVGAELLAAAASLDVRREFPTQWRTLAQFLPARSGPKGEPVYSPFHKSLADWLTSDDTVRNSEFGILAEEGHTRLADQGWQEYLRDVESLSGYQLRHLPHHLMATYRQQDFLTLLTDFDYLQRRVAAGQIFELVLDLLAAAGVFTDAQKQNFDLWYSFVRSNAPFLAQHPECFFQQAFNEPRDSPVSLAAQERWNVATESAPTRRRKTHLPDAFLEWTDRPSSWQPSACLLTLSGHGDIVRCVAATPDGGTIISGSWDHTLRIWDNRTGACRRILSGHAGFVEGVAVTPDGATAVSGSDDHTLKVWDLVTGTCRATLTGHDALVRSVAITPDGQTAVSASDDFTIRIWDLRTGTCRRVLTGHERWVYCVAVADDAVTIVSGAADKTIRIWNGLTGECRRTLTGHTETVRCIALAADGKTIVTGSSDFTVRVWDGMTGACRHILSGHQWSVWSVAVTRDGRTAVSGGRDNAVILWDLTTGTQRQTLLGHSRSVDAVALAGDGRHVISGSSDRTVKIWDVQQGSGQQTMTGHRDIVWGIAVTPDLKTVVTGSLDETIRVWDAERCECRITLEGDLGWIVGVAITTDGNTIVSGSDDHTVRIWDVPSRTCRAVLTGHEGWVRRVGVSADGALIVSESDDQSVRTWDAASGTCLTVQPATSEAGKAAWSRVSAPSTLRTSAPEGLLVHFLNAGSDDEPFRLTAPGPFHRVIGPLATDTFLTFTSNGQARWFRIRRNPSPPA